MDRSNFKIYLIQKLCTILRISQRTLRFFLLKHMVKKLFPFDLFLKLLKEQPVCYLYSLATAGILGVLIYVLYK
jgi:hypothetical protein